MIKEISGDIFESPSEALVNPVNCKGVMGAGLALQFKRTYPRNFRAYSDACKSGMVKPGKMLVYGMNEKHVRYIINFPTKNHWKDASRLQDIESGMKDLIEVIRKFNIKSISIPMLGCGLGGLSQEEVLPIIKAYLKDVDVEALLYIGK